MLTPAAPADAVLWAQFADGKQPTFRSAFTAAREEMPRPSLTVTTVFTEGAADPLGVLADQGTQRLGQRGNALFLPEVGDGLLVTSWRTQHPSVWHVASLVHVTSRPWRRLETSLFAMDTNVSRVRLDAEQFAQVAAALHRLGDARVRKIATRSRSLRREAVDVSYPTTDKPTPLDVLAEQDANGNDVITMLVGTDDAAVHVRRSTGASLYRGDVGDFERHILHVLAEATEAKRQILSGRSRHEGQPLPEPVVVDLPTDRFNGAADTQVVLDLLLSQANCAVAVLHRNPYFHAVVTDLTDGSSFDVLITNSRQVEVYSGFEARTQQLARVTHALSDALGASRLTEGSPLGDVSIEDITSRDA